MNEDSPQSAPHDQESDHKRERPETQETDGTQDTLDNSSNKNTTAQGSTSAKFLRILGATLLILSAFMFLVQGWNQWSHTWRYLSFLGLTALIGLGGLFCQYKLKEQRGATTFLGLTVAFVPVHMAQLGALLFSLMPQAKLIDYPATMRWVATDSTTTLGIMVLAFLVLIPLTDRALSILIGPAGRITTFVLFGVSSLLLLPSREVSAVSIMSVIGIGALLCFEIMYARRGNYFKNIQGAFVKLVLWSPIFILVGRGAALYEEVGTVIGIVFIGLGILFVQGLAECFEKVETKGTIEGLGSWIALIGGIVITKPTVELLGFSPNLNLAIGGILLGITMVVIYLLATYEPEKYLVRASGIATFCLGLNALDGTTPLFQFLAAATGLTVLLRFSRKDHPLLIIVAAICFLAGLFETLRSIYEFLDPSWWLIVAVVGAGIVLLSSFLEKKEEEQQQDK